jgi:hypothetical protein
MTSVILRKPTPSSKNSSRSRKKRIKASPFLARVLSLAVGLVFWNNVFTAELKKLLAYK